MKIKIDKKAMTAGFIVGIMITLVAFVIISGVLIRFTSKFSDKSDDLLCKSSIDLRASTALRSNWEVWDVEAFRSNLKVVPALCKTKDKRVKGNREKIKKEFANSMATCWNNFGQGKYEELFDNGDLEILPGLFGFEASENSCFNCYTLNLVQDEISGGPISAAELQDYLINNNYKNTNYSYLDYIQSFGGPGQVIFAVPAILPHEAYAISMAPKNKEVNEGEFWEGAAKIAGGAVLTVAIGTAAACTFGTGGICGVVLAASSAVIGEGATLALGAAAETVIVGTSGVVGTKVAVIGTAVAVTGSLAATHSGYQQIMSTIYGERDVSTIILGDLNTAQSKCGSGDVAGE